MVGWLDEVGGALQARVGALMARPWEAVDATEVDALLVAMWRWQRARNVALDRVARAFLGAREPSGAAEIPGVPTEVFKVARGACFGEAAEARVFLTSGTTTEARGRHAFAQTDLYAQACVETAARMLLPLPRYRCVFVAESESDAPHSSLSFMLARFAERWGLDGEAAGAFFVRDGRVDAPGVLEALRAAVREGVPVALLGTSFGFVHLLDQLSDGAAPALPAGSVAMLTGGFKGRAREVPPVELARSLRGAFGAGLRIAHEYGMTELSSQAYDRPRADGAPGLYHSPPWMRLDVVDPVTLAPLGAGAVGLVRVLDLANLGSTVAVQTSDLGRMHPEGLELLGRAPGATPRGCARAMDALLDP